MKPRLLSRSVLLSASLLTAVAAVLAAPPPAVAPGSAGVWVPSPDAAAPIFREDFEKLEAAKLSEGYRLIKDASAARAQVLAGQVSKPNQALKYLVPFGRISSRAFTLSFYARSPDQTRCAVWIAQQGQQRRALDQADKLPKQWKRFEFSGTLPTDAPGVIEIVVPSSYGGALPGQAVLDSIELRAASAEAPWLDHLEDFPALCSDGATNLWLAVVARPRNEPQLRLYRVTEKTRERRWVFAPEGITGVGAPDIAPRGAGCVVSVPVERAGRWEVAVLFFNASDDNPAAVHYLGAGGSANIEAALDVRNDQALVVWQSNQEIPRRIYAARVTVERAAAAQALSAPDRPASNPDAVWLDNDRAFAAWDSFDGESVNLYGVRLRDTGWGKPQRLTSDPRIERHVRLAAHGGEAWLAWQAQSFKKHLINGLSEQRIVVAKLTGNGLEMVSGLQDKLGPPTPANLFMRPQLAFTPAGALVLSARHSMGAHTGWRALAWTLSGSGISGPSVVWSGQGRWRPIPMAPYAGRFVAACQRDNLPSNWGVDTGVAPDWKGDVVVVPVATDAGTSALPLTDFSLPVHIATYSARLPRATQDHNGTKLSVYWGDLHEHSDLSVCQRAQNPPLDDLWANQRDIEMLDFTAITDHGYNMDHPQWRYSAERVRAHYDAGAFISLLAEEWTSDHIPYGPPRAVRRYGHHNLVFLDTFFPRFYDSRDEPAANPRQVWDAIGDAAFISIPHQLADTGNTPADWTHHDEQHQPLAEIFQQRESYEALGAPRQAPAATPFKGHFLQDAWALGLIIGVIASPDHGGSKGKAAVWAEDLSREGLFKAFHARHTFGTSGARMNLWLGSGANMMGDKAIRPDGPIPFTIWTAADRPITKVVVIRNNREVFTAEPATTEVRIDWTDSDAPKDKTLWYYVRIHRDDGELAWSSPIWFFSSPQELEATTEHARNLPLLHPHGPPSEDPGPGVNLRKKRETPL
jgi:hypothetical protein